MDKEKKKSSAMDGDYLLTLDREACIGAGSCVAVDPEHWELVDDGKADLLGGEQSEDNAIHSMKFTEEQLELMKDSAESCPVLAIHIKRLKDGEELI